MPRKLSRRYEPIRLLGQGGMGAVYLARQVELDRLVAVKLLRPDVRPTRRRVASFKREVMVAKQLTHPNTVRLYDFGQTPDGDLFLVMEYLVGHTLAHVLRAGGPLPPQLVAQVGRQVLKSLIEAHAIGVVHRDIKPSNVMLCQQLGEPFLVKVLDFGVARFGRESQGEDDTASGQLVGTPHYLSPEQALGQDLDQRTDLYSLGITLFELATGEPPYTGDSPIDIAMKHASPRPVALPAELATTPLGPVLARALEKDMRLRFSNAEEMLHALDEAPGLGFDPSAVALPPGLVPDTPSKDVATTHETVSEPLNRTLPDAFETSAGTLAEAPQTEATPTRPDPPASEPSAEPPWPASASPVGGRLGRRAAVAVMGLLSAAALAYAAWPGPSPPVGPRSAEPAPAHREAPPLEAPLDLSEVAPRAAATIEQAVENARARLAAAAPAAPTDVTLAIDSEPPGARVSYAGAPLCVTPCAASLAPEGTSEALRVELDGYLPVEERVTLNQNRERTYVLVAAPESGSRRAEGERDERETERERPDPSSGDGRSERHSTGDASPPTRVEGARDDATASTESPARVNRDVSGVNDAPPETGGAVEPDPGEPEPHAPEDGPDQTPPRFLAPVDI